MERGHPEAERTSRAKRTTSPAEERRWQDENSDAFAAQAAWHERHGHPLADIIAAPGKTTWTA
jgi:antitoxin CcdA